MGSVLPSLPGRRASSPGWPSRTIRPRCATASRSRATGWPWASTRGRIDWRHSRGAGPRIPTLGELADELVGQGVARLVLSHGGGAEELAALADLARSVRVELLVAGGVRDLDGVRRLRDAGVGGIILGEALLSGAIDYTAAREAAA